MSPAMRWNDHAVIRMVEEGKLPPSRIHLDAGGQEGRGMVSDARRLRKTLVACGWQEGLDLQYVEDPQAGHNEPAWAERLPDALRFLLSPFRSTGGVPE
jgi:predicted alpha/beta superfamily hydrolase